MNSRAVFEEHFRSADVLLRVYRLLEAEGGAKNDHAWLPQIRVMLTSTADEEILVLLNELFMGVVRERADMRSAFFRQDNLAMLLRQAVVATCSALDVFVPHLLRSYLPDVVLIRQRNFMPNDGEVRNLMKEFRLSLDDVWPFVEEADSTRRWELVAGKILDYMGDKALSNEAGISSSLKLLSIEEPWKRIAERIGDKEEHLRSKIRRIVSRRNDIVHRADRERTDPNGLIKSIDYAWTKSHLDAVEAVALASYALVVEKVDELKQSAQGTT
jgi:hypothetical protein